MKSSLSAKKHLRFEKEKLSSSCSPVSKESTKGGIIILQRKFQFFFSFHFCNIRDLNIFFCIFLLSFN